LNNKEDVVIINDLAYVCVKVFGRYVNGHKRCQHCNIFIKYEGLRCPWYKYQDHQDEPI